MQSPDWDTGLPPDVLALVVKCSGGNAVKEMRGVSKTWQQGFEIGVTAIKLRSLDTPLFPSGEELARRFPGLTKLDLWNSSLDTAWLANLRAFPKLDSIILGSWLADPPIGSLTARLKDFDLQHLQGTRLRHLDLSYCRSLTDAALEPLRGLPLSSLHLRKCVRPTAAGLECLEGMPLTRLDLCRCFQTATYGLFEHLRGLPLTSLALDRWQEEGEGIEEEEVKSRLEVLWGKPLSCLSLRFQSWLTAWDVEALRGLPITILNLGYCSQIFNDVALASMKGLRLSRLCLAGCELVTDAGLEHLRRMPLSDLDLC